MADPDSYIHLRNPHTKSPKVDKLDFDKFILIHHQHKASAEPDKEYLKIHS